MRAELSERLAHLPTGPGVYLMKDKAARVFYVGKAKSLRDRVRSYFSGSDTRSFVAHLDVLLFDLEVVLTHSEKEALLLESELIKRHRPRFNVKLTDDKRFLCLRLDARKPYPRLQVVRRFAKDGAQYFGPYHSASKIRETLRLINRHFQLRTCTDQMMNNRSRPCLQFQIKRCPAPCVFDLTDGRYAQNIADVSSFLRGDKERLIEILTERMQKYAEEMQFEAAGSVRDQIEAINRSLERQRMVTSDFINRDVIGLYREGPVTEIHVMRTRGGRLMDARRFSFEDTELPTPEVLADFANRFYAEEPTDSLPSEVLFSEVMEWDVSLGELLAERLGKKVEVLTPQRGDKKRLVELATQNAQQAYIDKRREAGAAKTAIERLQRALHLKQLPARIECMDISHIQGSQIVASVVHLKDGVPDKTRYRHYKIRSTVGQDDFKSMYEVVSRRMRRGLEKNDLPDLIVIDGGKGQLAAARAALVDHGVESVDMVGLAKSRKLDEEDKRTLRRPAFKLAPKQKERSIPLETPAVPEDMDTPSVAPAGGDDTDSLVGPTPDTAAFSDDDLLGEAKRSPERVFVFGHKTPIVLRQNSAELFLLVRARNEAHRFAITFHRKLRQKAATRSILDDIPGVGPNRRRKLLRHFGSVARVKAARREDMVELLGDKLGAEIFDFIKQQTASE